MDRSANMRAIRGKDTKPEMRGRTAQKNRKVPGGLEGQVCQMPKRH
jgi:G:T-mismatch repair DNA endonuclease (very short patch repair protein)